MSKLSETISIVLEVVDNTKNRLKATATQLREVGKAGDKGKVGADKAGKSIKKTGDEAEKAKDKFKKLGKETKGVGSELSKMAGQATAAAAVLASIAVPIFQAAGFERQMAEVKAISGATAEEYAKLTASAEAMGRKTEYSAKEAANGLKFLTMAGLSANQAMTALPATLNLAMTGQIGLGEAADFATNILGGFRLQVSDLTHVVDVLANTATSSNSTVTELAETMSYAAPKAAAMGVSLDVAAAAAGLLHNNGIKASRAGTGLSGIFTRLAVQTPKAAAALEKLGVQISYFEDGSLNLQKTMADLRDANMGLAEASAIFGIYAAGSALVLAQSADQLDTFTTANERAAGKAEEMARIMNENAVGSWKNFMSAVTGLAITIGKTFLPAITATLNAITPLVNGITDLATAFPKTTSAILLLVGGFATLKIASLAVSLTMKAMRLVFKGVAVDSVAAAAGTTTLSGSIMALGRSMLALALANPILTGIAIGILALVAAYKLLAKDSLASSKKHAEAAKKIGEAKKEIDNEVTALEKLEKTLLNTKQGTDEHTAAEEELGRVLPGVNETLDSQGRVLGEVGDALDENAIKLREFIDLKKEEARIQAGLQLEAQARAYYEAGDAVTDYKENLRQWYGIGEKSTNVLQDFIRGVNRLTGTYDTNIAKGSEMRTNLADQKKGFEDLLTSMIKAGATSNDVNEMLNSLHIDPATKAKILQDYDRIAAAIIAAGKKGAEGAKGTLAEQVAANEEATKKMIEQYKKYAQEIEKIQDEIAGRERSLAAQLREMGRSGMSEGSAWRDRRAEAEEYYLAAQRAAKAGEEALKAGDADAANRHFDEAKMMADEAKDAYADLKGEVKEGDQVIVSAQKALKTAMSGVESSGKLAIDILGKQKQAAIDAANALDKKAGGALSEELGAAEGKLGDVTKASTRLGDNLVEQSGRFGKAFDEQTARIDAWLNSPKRVQIVVEKVEGNSTGGLIGAIQRFAAGGAATVQKFAGGGFPRRSGALSGFGGGDKIKALLEAGEFIMNKFSVRKYGLGLMHAINSGTLDIGQLIKAKTGGFIANMPAPQVQPVRFSAGGAVQSAGGGDVVRLDLNLPTPGDPIQATIPRTTLPELFRQMDVINRRAS